MTIKATGISLEMTQYLKAGRLSQYVEPLSEAAQLLEKAGWKQSDQPSKTFAEMD